MASVPFLAVFSYSGMILSAMATPTSPAINAAETSNQVSWHSAFWALVPIALNSMSQPSGKVLGLSAKYGFFLNSSPIICVANALELVFKLTWRTLSMRSLDEAARSVADDLFGNDESVERPNRITRLQESKTIRLILFVFGALPQVVKLGAMRGIVRTQICAFIFLGSFTVIEAIMFWLKKFRAAVRDQGTALETPNNNKLDMIRGLLICTGHSSAVCLVAATSAELAKPKTIVFIAILTGSLYASMTDTLYVFLTKALQRVLAPQHVDSLTPSRRASDHQERKFFSVMLVMVLCDLIFEIAAISLDSEYYTKAAVIFSCNLFLGLLIGDWDKPVRTAGGDYPFNLRPRGYILFTVLQILAAVSTYAFSYDPTNTYKPGWTNKLG